MSWKEFFKPTIGKIILALLMLSYPFIILVITGGVEGICWGDSAKYHPICKIFEYINVILFFPLVIFRGLLIRLPPVFGLYLYYFVFVLYSYFLPCLIIFIYNKLKSKNKVK